MVTKGGHARLVQKGSGHDDEAVRRDVRKIRQYKRPSNHRRRAVLLCIRRLRKDQRRKGVHSHWARPDSLPGVVAFGRRMWVESHLAARTIGLASTIRTRDRSRSQSRLSRSRRQ